MAFSTSTTVFNPQINEMVGKSVLDHAGKYPFVATGRTWPEAIDCRGVPDVVHTWQNEIKGQRDMFTTAHR